MKFTSQSCVLGLALTLCVAVAPIHGATAPDRGKTTTRSLFDGKTLNGWKITNFGSEGEVAVEEGAIQLGFGSSLTGITYQGPPLPTVNYEISLEAKRVDGTDFFCGLTFPVGKSHCSLVLGGWGGSTVGLSSIDHQDASENETTQYMRLENGRWYRVRVRVLPERIQAWIDDKQIINVDLSGRKIDTRIEMELSKPLGIAAWETRSALRNIELKPLDVAANQPNAKIEKP